MGAQQEIAARLRALGIEFEAVQHEAVYTIEEMERLPFAATERSAKNLFLRDDKKARFFLVSVRHDKKVDLRLLQEAIGSRRLSFASEAALFEMLKLERGAVSPLGVLNDSERRVEVLFDNDLFAFARIGVHPNENTATFFMAPADLERAIREHGNSVKRIDVPAAPQGG